MLKGGDKTIINVTSIGALHVHPGASSYQPSKLAVCRLTEFACEEFGEEGLLCYCVHPGGGKRLSIVGRSAGVASVSKLTESW